MVDAKEILLKILSNHRDANKWDNATFKQIKRVSNTKVGDVGQDFIEKLSETYGYECIFPLNKKGKRAKQSSWDVQIGGVKFELKTASEDVKGAFQFNHIRYHRSYEGVICLGIAPNDIYFSIWSKAQITTGEAGHLVSMEKKANASFKLTKRPKDLYPIDKFEFYLTDFLKKFKKH